ncbi:MAG: ABC transporter ATP-binding protein [Thermoleophilia bacterium]
MPLLEFDQVGKIYGLRESGSAAAPGGNGRRALRALSGISLSISKGESIGIVGESGAGKSTLAAIATGQTFPTTGRIIVDGQERDHSAASRRSCARKVQLVWQDAAGSVDPRLTVESILAEPLLVHGRSRKEAGVRIDSLLSEVGLPAEFLCRYPHELSGGELQRLVIARALSLDPELLICDEPASALDAVSKLRVAGLLLSLQKRRNMALMIIAHDLPLVRRTVSEIAVMYRGTIVELGPAELLTGNPLHPYTRQLFASDPSLNFRNSVAPAPIAATRTSSQTLLKRSTTEGRGCVFQSDCDDLRTACAQTNPGLIKLRDGRQIACVLA